MKNIFYLSVLITNTYSIQAMEQSKVSNPFRMRYTFPSKTPIELINRTNRSVSYSLYAKGKGRNYYDIEGKISAKRTKFIKAPLERNTYSLGIINCNHKFPNPTCPIHHDTKRVIIEKVGGELRLYSFLKK